MKRSKLMAAAGLAAAIFAVKAMFPAAAAEAARSLKELFPRDIDYVEVFSGAEGSCASERGDTAAEAEAVYIPAAEEAPAPEPSDPERAVNEGEAPPAPEPEPPPAVAAFLESQREFADYALPETVSYEYTAFPGEIAVPVAGLSSSGFGYRIHPIKGEVLFHYGSDFAAWTGEEIRAFADGTVSFAGYCDSYGNYITVDHAEGWQSLYAHCSELYKVKGDEVKAGETIALVGATGLVTGPHLHFELSRDGIYVNPEYYVN